MQHGPMSERIHRIVIIGSASIHTWRFIAGITPYVEEIFVATTGDIPQRYCPTNLVEVKRLDFRLCAWQTVSRLRRWINALSPQLVHIHQANSIAWHATRALRNKAIPTVLTAWGSDVLLLPDKHRLMKYIVRHNLQAVHAITSDSYAMAARIRQLVAPSPCRIKLLNYGIDVLPKLTGVAAKAKQVLSCRLHKPLYRIDAILRAWQVIEHSARFPGWELTVAANGVETEELKRLAQRLSLKAVHFVGFLSPDALAQWYAKSRVFISIPLSDATSISLLEAMSHGCLPILSNLPANAEWVIDGLNGVIVEDVLRLADDLARGMILASDDAKLQNIALINRELVADKALYQKNMGEFAALYRELNKT